MNPALIPILVFLAVTAVIAVITVARAFGVGPVDS